jgi:hypothetical protein
MINSLRVGKHPWLAAPLGGENPQAIFRDPQAGMPAGSQFLHALMRVIAYS